ncbi:hypothetical protein EDD74_1224 [Faecalimonas umbilicata]|uniref:Tail tube protein n=1 Tax=Faecalimonas umbilicata TaxID=1912855 RepID=A0A4V6NYL4_9FIRM|nr:hypothetical protein [Faecalimonas umbilicata]TCS65511.1 hypothetical protein EDD74_1224 [Faecalimonas umbilicata]GBU06586.1 hypothetical protein FAEUMB_31270 [Faecalimonas umbilicata]
MATKKGAIQRHEIADYLNVATTSEAKWALMGYGFTTLDEEFGAESESAKYINEASESSSVVSYKSVFPFTTHLIPDEEAVNALYTVGRDHLTGEDAEFEYVRVELWNKKEADKYAARKFTVSAEVSSMSGEKKQELSGNLNAVGDPVDGTFDIKAKKFEVAVQSPV